MTLPYRHDLYADAEAERDAREDADAEWRRASVLANDQAELAAQLAGPEAAYWRAKAAEWMAACKRAIQERDQLRQERDAARGALITRDTFKGAY